MDGDPLSAYGLGGAPLGIAVAALFLIVMARSHATYWAGRGVTRGAQAVQRSERGFGWWRSAVQRLERWTDSPAAHHGMRLVQRWGPVAVTVAYLTVGVQTAVFASAGIVRMRYASFTIASVPGALAWAVIWATIGLGALWAAVRLFVASPGVLVALLLAVGAAGVVLARRRRRPTAPVPAATGTTDARDDA
ncbi:DedA family protein [Cellulomonas fimi]|uniref:Membrane-associated protein n=1 Tax=Cellulomonas fimi (strain ATCC 484 / DSM 20113 / JCM 1341 / CCUG 24087 / LMG 16345 / NBRC 15513 / NCIMB 8980 / NCTC 7547 / NRS-133) TaxID=590998 RepID=F4H2V6_CELFA|nr:VTT domain-containing protein [Cellulomonas fimi]AEE46455.1 membrane-associated protein [Cellulomonas fimi ATCC 484]NNH07747.1 hypothetical protein [Cellulomonas fimi]VEH33069.1 SNARE associated Golgi protein [Cellulomonas fimi]